MAKAMAEGSGTTLKLADVDCAGRVAAGSAGSPSMPTCEGSVSDTSMPSCENESCSTGTIIRLCTADCVAGEIVIAVDAAWKDRKRKDEYLDYVTASHPYTARYGEEEAELRDIGPKISKIDGEWIGLLKASPGGTDKIRETLTELSAQKNFRAMRCDALLRELVKKGVRVSIVYITGHWLDVDSLEDLSTANSTAGI